MKYLAIACLALLVSGCAVVAVADLAAGAAVGAVKLTGKAVGVVVDAVTPDGDDKK